MSENQGTNSSVSIFKWIYTDVSKQICSGHDWIIFFSFMKPKNCVFHISSNKISRCKNMMACECKRVSISKTSFPSRCFSLCIIILCVCLIISMFTRESDVFCMYIHTLVVYHLPEKVAYVIW